MSSGLEQDVNGIVRQVTRGDAGCRDASMRPMPRRPAREVLAVPISDYFQPQDQLLRRDCRARLDGVPSGISTGCWGRKERATLRNAGFLPAAAVTHVVLGNA